MQSKEKDFGSPLKFPGPVSVVELQRTSVVRTTDAGDWPIGVALSPECIHEHREQQDTSQRPCVR